MTKPEQSRLVTFLEWCRAQRKRPDAVGDFARDWCADPERPRAPSEAEMVAYLYTCTALEDAVVAGKAAHREWRASGLGLGA